MLIIDCTNVRTSPLTFETQGFAATFSPIRLPAIVEQQDEQTNALARSCNSNPHHHACRSRLRQCPTTSISPPEGLPASFARHWTQWPPLSPLSFPPTSKPVPLPPKPPPMLKFAQPLHLPIVLVQRLFATIDMVRAIVARTMFSIVTAARAKRVWSVCVGRCVGSQRVGARIRVLHVEGQVVRLGSRESDRVVDAEELVEKAGTFAALDVAAAAAGVEVGVEWHERMRS